MCGTTNFAQTHTPGICRYVPSSQPLLAHHTSNFVIFSNPWNGTICWCCALFWFLGKSHFFLLRHFVRFFFATFFSCLLNFGAVKFDIVRTIFSQEKLKTQNNIRAHHRNHFAFRVMRPVQRIPTTGKQLAILFLSHCQMLENVYEGICGYCVACIQVEQDARLHINNGDILAEPAVILKQQPPNDPSRRTFSERERAQNTR